MLTRTHSAIPPSIRRANRLLTLLAGSAFLLPALCIPAASAQTVETLTGAFQASGGVSVGPDGLVYVADFGNTLTGAGGANIYRVTLQGVVTVFASGFLGASGNEFDTDGSLYQSDIGRGLAARIAPDGSQEVIATGLATPVGIAPAPDGNVYVNECGASAVTRIAPDGTKVRIAQGAPLDCPNGLALGPDGHLYVVNFNDSKMLRITLPDGKVSAFAAIPGGGNGHVARANGRLYVASFRGRKIYEVTLNGDVRALAGTGGTGNADGPADEATFFRPNGIAASIIGDTLFVNTTMEIVEPSSPVLHPNTVRMITGVLQTVGTEAPVDERRGADQPAPSPLAVDDPLYVEILRLENERFDAYGRRDSAHLARDFAEEYLHTNLRGGTTTKAEELGFYGSDDFSLGGGEIRDMVVRRYGDAVVMTGHVTWCDAAYRGVDLSGDYRVTRTYVWRDKRWQIVASHASRVGG